ncbi:MAG: hypothetical protein ACFB20_12625 [Opitutales bacterium]
MPYALNPTHPCAPEPLHPDVPSDAHAIASARAFAAWFGSEAHASTAATRQRAARPLPFHDFRSPVPPPPRDFL